MARHARPLRDRFEEYFTPEPNSGCWLWTGRLSGRGYGHFYVGDQKSEESHRVSWRLYRGDIPPGLCVMHSCDNPLCVNPDHLSLGTKAQNLRDMVLRGRSAKGSRHSQAVLTERQVAEIRAAGHLPAKELASRYGVHLNTINMIRRRAIWKHVA